MLRNKKIPYIVSVRITNKYVYTLQPIYELDKAEVAFQQMAKKYFERLLMEACGRSVVKVMQGTKMIRKIEIIKPK